MRLLVTQPGPNFSVHDVYAGWVEALRELGQHVAEFNFGDRLTFYGTVLVETTPGSATFRRALTGDQAVELAVNGLYAAMMKTRPHVLLVVSAFFLPPEVFILARASGIRVVLLCTESPYEDGRQLDLARHAELVLINDPTNLAAFAEVTRARYMPHAYRPSIHRPGAPAPDLACDFAFVGTGYPSRASFFEAMDLSGLDVILAGNWQHTHHRSPLRRFVAHDLDDCFDNADAADLYRSARIGINLYRREAESEDRARGWSMGPREVEMAACGLPFLRDPRPEGDELLDMLPTFTSPEEATGRLRWWLTHDGARETAARKARDAIADRTFTHNAAELLRLLDKE